METSVSIRISGPLLQGKSPAIIQQHQEEAITEAVMFLLPRIKMNTPVGVFGDQGGLRASEQAEVQGKGTPVVRGIIATASIYGEVVEKGRRPNKGMPPKGSLVRWLEVKLGLDEKTAQRVEFVVRRKIGKKGFPGTHMFEKGLEENMGALQGIFQKHGFDLAEALNG